MKLAFIGYGQVGAPLADHLQRVGHQVTLAAHDPNSESVKKALAKTGNLKGCIRADPSAARLVEGTLEQLQPRVVKVARAVPRRLGAALPPIPACGGAAQPQFVRSLAFCRPHSNRVGSARHLPKDSRQAAPV